MKKILSLGVITDETRVLLGVKKRGFGEGLWNGFGGKLEEGETVEESLVRETKEECGVTLTKYEKKGVLEFHYVDQEDILEVHVYECVEYEGEPAETEEMRPEWFSLDEIPYGIMWADDIYWYPLFLEGKKFKGSFWFDKDGKVTKHELEEVEEL
jgi:mutator protein MutT